MTRQRLVLIAGAAVAIAVAGNVAIAAAIGLARQSQDVRVREFSVTARKVRLTSRRSSKWTRTTSSG